MIIVQYFMVNALYVKENALKNQMKKHLSKILVCDV